MKKLPLILISILLAFCMQTIFASRSDVMTVEIRGSMPLHLISGNTNGLLQKNVFCYQNDCYQTLLKADNSKVGDNAELKVGGNDRQIYCKLHWTVNDKQEIVFDKAASSCNVNWTFQSFVHQSSATSTYNIIILYHHSQ